MAKSRVSLWLKWTLLLFAALSALLLFLPKILGNRWVYQPLLDRLQADGFHVAIDRVNLNWFQQLSLEGIQVHEEQGPVLIAIDRITTSQGILGYLFGGRQLGALTVDTAVIDVELLSNSSNLQRLVKAFEDDSNTQEQRDRPRLDLDVNFRQLQAKVLREGDANPLVIIPPFDLQVSYRGNEKPSRVILQPTQVLREVQLTPELMQLGLEHAVPILAHSAWFDGKVSLAIDRWEIPLDAPESSQGKARLTMHSVRSGPSQESIVDLLDWIAKLRGKELDHELVFVDGSQIDIEMRDGTLAHQGLQVGLPRLDPRLQLGSQGRVGVIDRSLNLEMNIPIPLEQLAAKARVKSLGVPTLALPITGTLDDPKVDWKSLRGDGAELLGLIREQLEGTDPKTAKVVEKLEQLAGGNLDATISTAAEVFQQLRQQRQLRKQQTQPTPAQIDEANTAKDENEPTPRSSLRGNAGRFLRDTLKKALRGNEEPAPDEPPK